MRIRALKPGFFKSEELAELSPWHRLCFEGLWCCADRNGRMSDRPKRLKAEIFPYDDLQMDHLLWDLARAGFIRRYVIGAQPLIDIPSWDLHQHPRQDEAESVLAAYVQGSDRSTTSLDTSTYPAARPIDTVPSLSSDEPVALARMGNGRWEVGDGTVGDTAAGAAAFRAQDLMDLWNAETKPPLPRCRELTEGRRSKIRARIARRPSLAEWREAFAFVSVDPFYRGENDRGWVADFDYVLKNDTVVTRLLERARTTVARRDTVALSRQTRGLLAAVEKLSG